MKPTKVYIIRIDTPTSKEYAKVCADSCDKVGMKWEYYDGYMPTSLEHQNEIWSNFVFPIKWAARLPNGAAGCTMSHAALWKKIADEKDCAIILEHDAIMLQPCNIDIPDDRLVSMGYKYYNAHKYDYETAGAPKQVVDVDHNHGSHAYAVTHIMAQTLVDELIEHGIRNAIDNVHFLPMRRQFTKTKMAIVDPICALGWLRDSTIWGKSATENNVREMLKSFKDNFSGDIVENL